MRLEKPDFVFQYLQGFQSGLITKTWDIQFLFGFVTSSLPWLSVFLLNHAATIPTGKANFYITIPTLIINGDKYDHLYMRDDFGIMSTHHTYLYSINLGIHNQHHIKDLSLLENDWNHVEVICAHREVEPLAEIGIHFFKQDDIQFTNPYEKKTLDDNDVDNEDDDEDDDDDIFCDVDDVLDDDDDVVLDDEDDHHSQYIGARDG
jgi:hypothetical protein